MNDEFYFKKEILLETLKLIIANTSITIDEKKCTSALNLQSFCLFHTSICLKTLYDFLRLNKKYTRKEMAKKEFMHLYRKNYSIGMSSQDFNFEEYLDMSKFMDFSLNEDEAFILLSIFNLPKFFKTNNMNKIKHILNTYIPKVRACLKNSDKYMNYFDLENNSTLTIKGVLFKFLVENG